MISDDEFNDEMGYLHDLQDTIMLILAVTPTAQAMGWLQDQQ